MINEMKSFKEPHVLVGFVMNAVCLLYGVGENWKEGK
jgi:hypothetical protein